MIFYRVSFGLEGWAIMDLCAENDPIAFCRYEQRELSSADQTEIDSTNGAGRT